MDDYVEHRAGTLDMVKVIIGVGAGVTGALGTTMGLADNSHFIVVVGFFLIAFCFAIFLRSAAFSSASIYIFSVFYFLISAEKIGSGGYIKMGFSIGFFLAIILMLIFKDYLIPKKGKIVS